MLEVLIQTPVTNFLLPITSLNIQKTRNFGAGYGTIEYPAYLLQDAGITMDFGYIATIYEDKVPKFRGMVYDIDEDTRSSIKVQDSLIRFKNPTIMSYDNISYSDFVRRTCAEVLVPYGTIEETSYEEPTLVLNEQEYFQGAKELYQATFRNTGQRFILRDNVGKIELINNLKLISNIALTEDTNILSIKKTSSIAECANEVFVVSKEGETSSITEIEQDLELIAKWGLIRKIEEFPSLTVYKQPTQRITLEVIGSFNYDIGGIHYVEAPSRNMKGYFIIEEVTHSKNNEKFTSSITLADTVRF